MTPSQWADIITQTQQLWGHSPKWRDATTLYNRIRTLSHQTMTDVLTDLALAGRNTCPAPAELIGLTHQRTGTIEHRRPEPRDCRHATVAELTDGAPEYRVTERWCAICLDTLTDSVAPAVYG